MSNANPSRFELFMAGGYGRLFRIALGAALIVAGVAAVGGTLGWLIAALGLIPITAGVFNFCPVAPVWGGHFLGSKYCATKNGRTP